jgi:hypothetical protein
VPDVNKVYTAEAYCSVLERNQQLQNCYVLICDESVTVTHGREFRMMVPILGAYM